MFAKLGGGPFPAHSAKWLGGPCLVSCSAVCIWGVFLGLIELELELKQFWMAQKPVLWGEVGARALRVRSVPREEAWASAGVQGALVSGCGREAD